MSNLSVVVKIFYSDRDFGIIRQYVSRWKKQKDQIFATTHKLLPHRVNSERKNGTWHLMEEKLKVWIEEHWNQGEGLGYIQAIRFFEGEYVNNNCDNFVASDGLLSNFR